MGILIRQILQAGIDQIHFALRHQADVIKDFILSQADLPRDRFHFIIEKDPLGTAGALYGLKGQADQVLMINGDLLSGIDLGDMLATHNQAGNHLTIATHDEYHRLELGEIVSDEEGLVKEYNEKPTKVYRISSGTNLIGPEVLDLVTTDGWLSLPELVNKAVSRDLRVSEYHHNYPWIDINSEQELERAKGMLAADPVAFGLDPSQVGQ